MKQVADTSTDGNLVIMKEKAVEYFSRPGFLDLNSPQMQQNVRDSIIIANAIPLSTKNSFNQSMTMEGTANKLAETGSFFMSGSGIDSQLRSLDLKRKDSHQDQKISITHTRLD